MKHLVERYGLGVEVSKKLESLVRIVVEDERAPTTIRQPEDVVDRHIADSLSILELEGVEVAGRVADVGSGAGFPGVVLAIARPSAEVFLVESVAKKCRFMEGAVEALGLSNATVVCARVEEWREGLESCDLVTVRAVASLGVLAEYGAPLLRLGGKLVAWKGACDGREEVDAVTAADTLGLEMDGPIGVTPHEGAQNHRLYLFNKVRATPERFPRRAGMARKRPIFGSKT